MSKANKVIIAIIVGAAAYTGGSWYIGQQIQSGIESAVADTNMRYAEQTFSGLNDAPDLIKISKYEKGLFSSSVDYKLIAVSAQGKTIEYDINSEIDHGFFPKTAISNGIYTPLLSYAKTNFNLSEAASKQVSLPQGSPAASAVSIVSLNGDNKTYIELLPLEINIDEDITINFSGGNLTVDLKNKQSDLELEGSFESYTIKQISINEAIKVKDIKIDSKAKLLDDGNQQSTNILVNAIELSSQDNEIETNANDIAVNITSEQKGRILKSDVQYDIKQVLVDGNNVGNFNFGMQFENIDLPSLIEISQKYTELVNKYGAASFSDLNISSAEQKEWIEKIKPFLAANPKLSLNPIAWGNEAGTSQAFFEISLSGTEGNKDDTIAVEKIVESSSFKLEISRSMIMSMFTTMAQGTDGAEGADEVGALLFDQYADLLVSQGIATKDGDKLAISIQVNPAQDKASINDKTMTMNEFYMLALGLIMFL